MKIKLLIGLGVIVGVMVILRLASFPAEKYKPGDVIQSLSLMNIHGVDVAIPSTTSKWVHLQFRRFAGCPICNLHLQSIVQRISEIEAAGIHEVVVFHSPKESLLPFQGTFTFDVIGDPEKLLYTQFGVEDSIFSILDVRVWPAMIRGIMTKNKPKGDPEGGALGLPADFLIGSDGRIVASHYGSHAYDQWSVDELLTLAK